MSDYTTTDVSVEGGMLRVGVWGEAGPVILACHGITANHRCFRALADQLGHNFRLIAPDLRGRGRSAAISGPFGLQSHAKDMIAVMDHLGLPHADLIVGHSMGGNVAVVTAAGQPDRIARLLLVDGGIVLSRTLPLHKWPFGDFLIERLTRLVIGPSLKRLDMTFGSSEHYRAHWRTHPAMRDDWSEYSEDFVDYDLVGTPPNLRPAMSRAALLSDIRAQMIEDMLPSALTQIRCPVHFLRAPRGMTNGKPLIPPSRLAKAAQTISDLTVRDVEDVNHFSIVMSERGATVVAGQVRSMLAN